MTGLKIIRLSAENVKRLKAVEITPEGNTVIISGRNAQGKSSILDAILYGLGGKDALKGTSRPIRDGESTAQVVIDLGDLVVRRNWTSDDKSYLSVTNREGAAFKGPQAILDALCGKLTFDPLKFAQMPEKEQVQTLLSLVELPVDLDELAERRQGIFDERTGVNRRLKQLEGQLSGLPEPPEGTPEQEVSAAEVMQRIEEAQDLRRQYDEKCLNLSSLHDKASALKESIKSAKDALGAIDANLQDELASLESEYLRRVEEAKERAAGRKTTSEANLQEMQTRFNQIVNEGSGLKKEVEAMTAPDLDALRQELTSLEQANRAVRAGAERRRVQKELEEAKAESDALTERIAGLDTQKAQAIAEADFPIEGLGFSEAGVTFGGLPLKQASSAEQLRVSAAIAAGLNPKLRVIRITDGSLLDRESMKILSDFADQKDIQIWLERVEDESEAAIVIEDGQIVERQAEEVAV